MTTQFKKKEKGLSAENRETRVEMSPTTLWQQGQDYPPTRDTEDGQIIQQEDPEPEAKTATMRKERPWSKPPAEPPSSERETSPDPSAREGPGQTSWSTGWPEMAGRVLGTSEGHP